MKLRKPLTRNNLLMRRLVLVVCLCVCMFMVGYFIKTDILLTVAYGIMAVVCGYVIDKLNHRLEFGEYVDEPKDETKVI